MKTAFACWENRIAPVFDTAREVLVVETASGQIVAETAETLAEDLPVRKTLHLAGLGVEALVCGAISRSLQDMVAAYGIRVFPFVAGELREVVDAWLGGGLDRGAFSMPGCGRRRRQRRKGLRGGGPGPAPRNTGAGETHPAIRGRGRRGNAATARRSQSPE